MPNLATIFADYYNNPNTFFKSREEENAKREMFAERVEHMASALGATKAYGNRGAAICIMLDEAGQREAFTYAQEHKLPQRARDAAPGFEPHASLPHGYAFSARIVDGVMTYEISTTMHPAPNHIVKFSL